MSKSFTKIHFPSKENNMIQQKRSDPTQYVPRRQAIEHNVLKTGRVSQPEKEPGRWFTSSTAVERPLNHDVIITSKYIKTYINKKNSIVKTTKLVK